MLREQGYYKPERDFVGVVARSFCSKCCRELVTIVSFNAQDRLPYSSVNLCEDCIRELAAKLGISLTSGSNPS